MQLLDPTVFQKCNRAIALKFYSSDTIYRQISYSQLWTDIQSVACILREQNIERKLVGVKLCHCPALIVAIGGIIVSGNSFCCIDYQSSKELLSGYEMCAAFILEDHGSDRICDGVSPQLGFRIDAMRLMLALSETSTQRDPELAFCVRTSGSTGTPKTVYVPKSCIMPNIVSLGEKFKLTEGDVIFVCSPPTFDPFVVDLLLGLNSGATLLMVDNAIRLSSHRLLPIISPGVTFMQMTPSLFCRWSAKDILERILGPQTTLRTLVLGGEKFPLLPVVLDCRTAVYNIYGITELSCWSLLQEVSLSGQTADVPLGTPLDPSIVLQLRDIDTGLVKTEENVQGGTLTGQLFIGSVTRKCNIIGEAEDNSDIHQLGEPLFRPTGDLVELTKKGEYVFRGRCNKMIKRYGCRVNLEELEEALKDHVAVEQCVACVVGENDRLVMFFKSSRAGHSLLEDLWKSIRSKLKPEQLPDELHRIERFPLSAHGKISSHSLRKLYEQIKQKSYAKHEPVEYFRAELSAMGIATEFQNIERNECKKLKMSSSFIDRGGTSIGALRLHARMEERLNVRLSELLTMLLSPNVPLEEALIYVERKAQDIVSDRVSGNAWRVNIENKLKISSQHDLEKCIDSRAAITFCRGTGHIVSVGSHSGMVLTINFDTNAVVSRFYLSDRIECSITFFSHGDHPVLGIVGCYDGFLYCFNPLNGTTVWKYDAEGMIKCTPVVLPDTNTIIVGSYGSTNNLHCLVGVRHSVKVLWKVKIGTKAILSQPVVLDGEGPGFIFVATLDGTIASINVATGCCVWSHTMCVNVPIFSTPVFLRKYNKIVVCAVDGTLRIYDASDGGQMSTYKFPGNVFSSFEIIKHSHDSVHLAVGCYDRNVHCVEYLPKKQHAVNEMWKIEVQSQIYATPLLIGHYLMVCASVGFINLVDLREKGDELKVVATVQMNGELFAAPVACDNVVFIGCRDNYLYKILVNA
ncbi:beta-alanine-activating enzyme [Anopheles nili]|uniref:beta-alanine-activating enzyme n=1 Tax=Anopheles nili TaxID=185578 RepID=UPI00237B8737|nr:beta-alanine-activating enzyme [Anopheles nili]